MCSYIHLIIYLAKSRLLLIYFYLYLVFSSILHTSNLYILLSVLSYTGKQKNGQITDYVYIPKRCVCTCSGPGTCSFISLLFAWHFLFSPLLWGRRLAPFVVQSFKDLSFLISCFKRLIFCTSPFQAPPFFIIIFTV